MTDHEQEVARLNSNLVWCDMIEALGKSITLVGIMVVVIGIITYINNV